MSSVQVAFGIELAARLALCSLSIMYKNFFSILAMPLSRIVVFAL